MQIEGPLACSLRGLWTSSRFCTTPRI